MYLTHTQDMESVYVCCPVQVAALSRADPPVQGVLPTVYKIHNFRINSEWEQAREPLSF
jgi:hypothetical protein